MHIEREIDRSFKKLNTKYNEKKMNNHIIFEKNIWILYKYEEKKSVMIENFTAVITKYYIKIGAKI